VPGPAHLDGIEDPDAAADQVVEALLAGAVVVLPTDTVYGLVALPGDASAIDLLFDLKGRSHDTPIAVLCASVRQALELVVPEDAAVIRSAGERWWPGPLTLVCRRHPDAELHLGLPESTVGLRVPDHPLVRAVAQRVGPLAATSANRHGEPTAATAEEALLAVGAGVAVVVDEGPLEGRASTVVDTTTTPWHVLREGPIPGADVVPTADVPLL
jgi:tRNA threonylcarbamoyl adenosine modification protein (Sua5/YciO/YrdC/YwlC family)